MRRTTVPLAALGLVAGISLAPAPAPAGVPIVYRFEHVKSRVTRLPSGDEDRRVRVRTGETATEGDVVRTGVFARAVLAVPERAVSFEISSSSRVRLAGPEPGVILVLESGRLKAAFDVFTGASEERRVAAPGALLAVRGTRYGLEAIPGGETVVAVFEGTVELFPADGSPSLRVERGEFCRVAPGSAPRKGSLERAGMNEKGWATRGSGLSPGGGDGRGGSGPGEGAPGAAGSQGRRPSGSGGRGGH
ncbi:MAG: FecR domain-containing protein [Thermoanaerobaculia bacterium]